MGFLGPMPILILGGKKIPISNILVNFIFWYIYIYIYADNIDRMWAASPVTKMLWRQDILHLNKLFQTLVHRTVVTSLISY